MKTFIFRSPFVTKKRKLEAQAAINAAITLCEVAERDRELNEGRITIEHAKWLQEACRLWTRAAKLLGFRNITDMDRYKQIHGTF